MIKSAQFPGKVFASKEELFSELRANADKIISCKTSEIYKSIEKGIHVIGFFNRTTVDETKAGPHMKDGYCYPVINTTKYLDSHDDVHLDGIWNKSAKEQNGKLFYVADHEIKTSSIIAWPADVNVMVKSVPWAWVGKDYSGNTEALIYEINKSSIVNPTAKDIIENKRPVQGSVRMQYVKVSLALNSMAKEDVQYKANWDKWIGDIANADVAHEQGYFFAVEEAKIIKEGSMVPFGSNDATPIQQRKDVAGTTTTEDKEPAGPATQKESIFKNFSITKK